MENLSRIVMKAIILLSILLFILLFILLSVLSGNICFSQPSPVWTPISGNQYNMIAFGQVHIDGVDPGQKRLVLYSFGHQGEPDCRSQSDIGPDGAYYATIRGNTRGEVISFRVYDRRSGKTYDLKDTITFEIDAVAVNFDIRL